ncbi:killer cell lectin-like receptor 2 [Rattus rattus]|uniref:killer cell lectin-like receptor 2 n=1 Tax=Rattus rattus TaxID=10117 RepID=UPI0013F39FC0|nr:killer cell lectin-like receptor 2 [Rattus rattus]
MSEQEVTYTTVRFHKSPGLQNQVRPEETQRPRKAGHRAHSERKVRECSVTWKPIVIVLGILCSLLLVTVAVLLTHIFQSRQEKHEQEQKLNNLHQLYHVMKNESSLMEERLRNKSLEFETCKNTLDNLKREQNRCYRESKIDLKCFKYKGKQVEGHWFCCGMKCYYFITDNVQWNGCKQICQACSLSLLKIDDEDEMNFLKSQLQGKRYWIGLTYNKSLKNWQWIGDPHKLDLAGVNLAHDRGNCPFLTSFQIDDDDCAKKHGCICEKRLNIPYFSDLCQPKKAACSAE